MDWTQLTPVIPMTEEHNASSHSFEDCPSCGGDLEYPTQSDAVCRECGDEFCHEIRGSNRHLLWSFTDDYRLDEVVARAQ